MKILLVEDELPLSEFMSETLEREGYPVTVSTSVEEVLEKKLHTAHEMIILDLHLEGKEGTHLVQEMRDAGVNTPIIVLSAFSQIETKVELINMGVNDYLTKPCDTRELLARIRRHHKSHIQMNESKEDTLNGYSFSRKHKTLTSKKGSVNLTKIEATLFELLWSNHQKTVSVEDLLTSVWGARIGFHSNILASTVARLRRKLREQFGDDFIHNVHGVGYRLIIPE